MISLRSKLVQKTLNFFFLNEGEKFYVNELAKIIKENPSNLHKKLLELKKDGLLLDEFRGKERFFSLNKKYPFLKEYKKIILKGFGFEKILTDKLKKIKGIDSAYIFGSYAKGGFVSESDIDLLIIGDFDMIKLQKAILEIQELTGREINSIEMTEKEFKRKKQKRDHFIKDIFSSKYIKII
ncbi:MAG: nucleotidyltransferase domain-containing protein [Candidatus Paceibacterota bacterium]